MVVVGFGDFGGHLGHEQGGGDTQGDRQSDFVQDVLAQAQDGLSFEAVGVPVERGLVDRPLFEQWRFGAQDVHQALRVLAIEVMAWWEVDDVEPVLGGDARGDGGAHAATDSDGSRDLVCGCDHASGIGFWVGADDDYAGLGRQARVFQGLDREVHLVHVTVEIDGHYAIQIKSRSSAHARAG